eukprot:scaffold5.g655.t1
MKRIFGQKKEKAPPPTLEQATDKLNVRGDTLDEKIRKLDAQLAQHRDAIRKCRPGPAQEAAKRRALTVLKQKRLYEQQRDQLYNQQYTIEQTSFAVQSMQDSVHTVQARGLEGPWGMVVEWRQHQRLAMAAAGKELKGVMKQKDMRLENIDKLRDEMEDLMDMQSEIQMTLGTAFGVPEDIDEEELMGELDALEDELAAEPQTAGGMPAYMQDVELPEVPQGAAAQPQAQAEAADGFGLPAVPQRT